MTHRNTLFHWGVPLLLAVYFSATAVLGVSAHYRQQDLLILLVLYLLLSVALYAGAAALLRLGRAAGGIGAFILSFVAVWHFREQTFLPGSISSVALVAALLAIPYFVMETRLLDGGHKTPFWRVFSISTISAVALWAGAYQTLPMMKWHLLRHNTMLGTPAYFLLDRSITARREALFDLHQEGDDRRPVPAVAILPEPAPDSERPNIVVVMLDTLRADALAIHGGDPAAMPRLNHFFDTAYRFTDVWANSSWTRSSIASLLTGLLPEEHGARLITDPLGEANVTLPEILQGWGYHTAAFVANVAAINREFGMAQGFDTWFEIDGQPYARAQKVRRTVEKWLAQDPAQDSKLLLYLHFLDPHDPYLNGEEPKSKRPEPYRAAYRRELEYLDLELGELLQTLELELTGPTVFFITSDHGEEFFEHELVGHGHTLHDEVVRVPTALRFENGEGADLSARLENRDFFDLLMRLAAGEELSVEAWSRTKSRDRRYASLYFGTEGRLWLRPYIRSVCTRALQQDSYKLIWSAFGDTYELYDLSADPGELVNLAAAEPERVAEMTAGLDAQVRFWTASEAVEVSGAALERLRALGYID